MRKCCGSEIRCQWLKEPTSAFQKWNCRALALVAVRELGKMCDLFLARLRVHGSPLPLSLAPLNLLGVAPHLPVIDRLIRLGTKTTHEHQRHAGVGAPSSWRLLVPCWGEYSHSLTLVECSQGKINHALGILDLRLLTHAPGFIRASVSTLNHFTFTLWCSANGKPPAVHVIPSHEKYRT